MTTETLPAVPQDNPAQAMAWLRHSLRLPHRDAAACELMRSVAEVISQPGDPARIMGYAAALLSEYFDREAPQSIRQVQAKWWAEALEEFPDWAVERACKWWRSEDNPKRRQRPLEGDIAARCRVEMEGIKMAMTVTPTWAPEPAPAEPRVSAEAARRILREFAFGKTRKPQT